MSIYHTFDGGEKFHAQYAVIWMHQQMFLFPLHALSLGMINWNESYVEVPRAIKTIPSMDIYQKYLVYQFNSFGKKFNEFPVNRIKSIRRRYVWYDRQHFNGRNSKYRASPQYGTSIEQIVQLSMSSAFAHILTCMKLLDFEKSSLYIPVEDACNGYFKWFAYKQ